MCNADLYTARLRLFFFPLQLFVYYKRIVSAIMLLVDKESIYHPNKRLNLGHFSCWCLTWKPVPCFYHLFLQTIYSSEVMVFKIKFMEHKEMNDWTAFQQMPLRCLIMVHRIHIKAGIVKLVLFKQSLLHNVKSTRRN